MTNNEQSSSDAFLNVSVNDQNRQIFCKHSMTCIHVYQSKVCYSFHFPSTTLVLLIIISKPLSNIVQAHIQRTGSYHDKQEQLHSEGCARRGKYVMDNRAVFA